MKNLKINFNLEAIFVGLFVLSMFIAASVRTPADKHIQQNKVTLDSLKVAVTKKQTKPSFNLDSNKKVNIKYVLSLSDFDTLRKDSTMILVPKTITLLNQVPISPVKKKKE